MQPPPDPIPPVPPVPLSGDAPPVLPADGAPPPLGPAADHKASSLERALAMLLGICALLFLADAALSLADETLIILLNLHALALFRGLVFIFAMLAALLVYLLMGLTPMIPKKLFLPLTLFNPLMSLITTPAIIYFYTRLHQVTWLLCAGQLLVGLWFLHRVQGGWKFDWRRLTSLPLAGPRFTWWNLGGFLAGNLLVLLPAVVIYALLCAALAVDHFSEGFVALRPSGLTVQARTYVRADGKSIQLLPMSHIGEPAFYRALSKSFPTNSIVLMEGVTDEHHLLTNGISYKKAAAKLGVVEQHTEFKPEGKRVRADIDVQQFSTNTLAFINLVMGVHARGLNPETVAQLLQFSPPNFEQQLFQDILTRRNEHLLEEIHARLEESEILIVPWGAAHIPGIAREIQKQGFRLKETREYIAIGF